ncbi:MAG: SET domain-containing protein [Candidatus Eisenbacteria bacterium]|uniref:SET domain-containing protein n=1 Tax=Eiseniibacteriota bacterium TaxID=2212470 RepID=A0A956NE80_UNCEI|nr:SET domain-containing protein [Candidatus Eisenbacteria bacterium]MCB9464142.1 SET domain-containing protein [Candidatus Eisenbacteria bacterium]
MLHPWTRLNWMSDEVGYGVVATRFIPKGTIIWALDPLDQVFTSDEVKKFGPQLWPTLERYSYVNGQGLRVLCWDHGRFMNHSCDPVSLSPGVDFELTVRDLQPGDEITCDYSSLNLEQDLECLCRSPHCRGKISKSQFAKLAPLWDRQLREAVQVVNQVEQPLLPWVKERALLERWASHPDELPSAYGHMTRKRDAVTRSAKNGVPSA